MVNPLSVSMNILMQGMQSQVISLNFNILGQKRWNFSSDLMANVSHQ